MPKNKIRFNPLDNMASTEEIAKRISSIPVATQKELENLATKLEHDFDQLITNVNETNKAEFIPFLLNMAVREDQEIKLYALIKQLQFEVLPIESGVGQPLKNRPIN